MRGEKSRGEPEEKSGASSGYVPFVRGPSSGYVPFAPPSLSAQACSSETQVAIRMLGGTTLRIAPPSPVLHGGSSSASSAPPTAGSGPGGEGGPGRGASSRTRCDRRSARGRPPAAAVWAV